MPILLILMKWTKWNEYAFSGIDSRMKQNASNRTSKFYIIICLQNGINESVIDVKQFFHMHWNVKKRKKK